MATFSELMAEHEQLLHRRDSLELELRSLACAYINDIIDDVSEMTEFRRDRYSRLRAELDAAELAVTQSVHLMKHFSAGQQAD